jgi:ankyrin repeat protein
VPTVPLPHDPNLEQLKKQAKDLQRAVRAGSAIARALVAEHLPGRELRSRADAQLVLARLYGFGGWTQLRRHLDVVARHSWRPSGADHPREESPANAFLRLACLRYEDDDPVRWRHARELLADDPALASADLYTAAACAATGRIDELLHGDPDAASRAGGPNGWPPLLYLGYARHDPAIPVQAVLDAAAALLAAGADPDAGFLWRGLPSPFTVLTGVFGGGEGGDAATPPHPHWEPLARLLLEAGADPNDAQALYNRMFSADDSHLRLLFEYGLGSGDGGPWRARLGTAMATPAEMLRGQLWWAITHEQRDRVRLLATHGVDVQTPFSGDRAPWATGGGDGVAPVALARLTGHGDVADLLIALGAVDPVLDPADTLLAEAVRPDRAAVAAVLAAHPAALAEAKRRRPGVVVQGAAQHRTDVVQLLVEIGFDVNARARGDAPIEQPWETALHCAAGDGDLGLVEQLLVLGADPTIHDARFDATPLGWARYFGHDEVAAALARVTSE